MRAMATRITILGLVAALGLGTAAESAYIFTSVPRLATRSDLIVKGTVAELKGDFFAFEVEHVLRGSLADANRQVLVARFKDWTCATRWASYAPGQVLILFLRKLRTSEPILWQIIGSGGEGEVVVDAQTAYFHTPEGVKECFDLADGRFCGDSAPLDHFLAGVVEYTHLYELPSSQGELGVISQIAKDADVDAFSERSAFNKRLIELTREPERAWSKKR